VDNGFRGLGVGTDLTRELLDRFKAAGCEKCFLEVRESNASAIALYRKLGFEQKHLIPHYYAQNVHAIKMRKDL
jgi:ribosomal-protein-alanine N-acetyltransferase